VIPLISKISSPSCNNWFFWAVPPRTILLTTTASPSFLTVAPWNRTNHIKRHHCEWTMQVKYSSDYCHVLPLKGPHQRYVTSLLYINNSGPRFSINRRRRLLLLLLLLFLLWLLVWRLLVGRMNLGSHLTPSDNVMCRQQRLTNRKQSSPMCKITSPQSWYLVHKEQLLKRYPNQTPSTGPGFIIFSS